MGMTSRVTDELTGPGIGSLSAEDQATIRASRPAGISAAEWDTLISDASGTDPLSVAASAIAAAETYRSSESEERSQHDGSGESDAAARKAKEDGEPPFTSFLRLLGEDPKNGTPSPWGSILRTVVETAQEIYNNPRETALSAARWLLKKSQEIWDGTQKIIDGALATVGTAISNTASGVGSWISDRANHAVDAISNFLGLGAPSPGPSATVTPPSPDIPVPMPMSLLTPGLETQTAGPALHTRVAVARNSPTLDGAYAGRAPAPYRMALLSDTGLGSVSSLAPTNTGVRPSFAHIVKAAGAERADVQAIPA